MTSYLNTCDDCGNQFYSDKSENTCPDCTSHATGKIIIVGIIGVCIFITIGNLFSIQTLTRYGVKTWWTNVISLQVDRDLFLKQRFALLDDTNAGATTGTTIPPGVCILNKGEVDAEDDSFVAVEFYSDKELHYGFIKLPTYKSAKAEIATDNVCPNLSKIEEELKLKELAAMRDQLSIEFTNSEEEAAQTKEMDAFYSVSELSDDSANLTAWVPKKQKTIVKEIRSTYSTSNNDDLFYQSNPRYKGVLSQ